LWAEKQDLINSKDSRKAWREIVRALNEKFHTNKDYDKCIRKIKYLVDLYKERTEWNNNQSGGGVRKSIFYDEIDVVLGCRDVVTLKHVQQTGNSTSTTTSANSSSGEMQSQDQDNDFGKP